MLPTRIILLYSRRNGPVGSDHTLSLSVNLSNYQLMRGVYSVLVGKPEGRRPLGRPRRGWEDNIRMDLREVGCGCVDWVELAQDRDRWRALVSAVMNFRAP